MNKVVAQVLSEIKIEDLEVTVRTMNICKKLQIKTLAEFHQYPWYQIISKQSNMNHYSSVVRLSVKGLSRLFDDIYQGTHTEYFLNELNSRYASIENCQFE